MSWNKAVYKKKKYDHGQKQIWNKLNEKERKTKKWDGIIIKTKESWKLWKLGVKSKIMKKVKREEISKQTYKDEVGRRVGIQV